MSKLDKLHVRPDSEMNAVIIYDRIGFAAQLNTTLQRAVRRADVKVHWKIKPWRLNALKDQTAGAEALLDAADAHLIVLAGRRAESLPYWLREWLTRWANIRQNPDAALAVTGNTDGGFSRLTTPELSRFVRQHALTFIIDEGPVARNSVRLFARWSRERELPVSIKRFRFAGSVTRDSFPRWGIRD